MLELTVAPQFKNRVFHVHFDIIIFIHPSIGMHILHNVLYTFLKVLIRRICLTIKSFLVGDNFLYSHDLNVWFRSDIVRRY